MTLISERVICLQICIENLVLKCKKYDKYIRMLEKIYNDYTKMIELVL